MWAQLICTTLGVWLMAAPDVLDYDDPARTNHHIVGPIVATLACIAIWEATRSVRWGNVPLGGWLTLAPWLLGFGGTATINSMATGILIIGLSLVRGEVRQRFAGGWSMLWRGQQNFEENAS